MKKKKLNILILKIYFEIMAKKKMNLKIKEIIIKLSV